MIYNKGALVDIIDFKNLDIEDLDIEAAQAIFVQRSKDNKKFSIIAFLGPEDVITITMIPNKNIVISTDQDEENLDERLAFIEEELIPIMRSQELQ
jgi:hypothetical protein